ncbi:MAG: hypothetical protein QOJ02_3906, partial [Acidobacteriota bacterium]|nr:hypothetical protein [Acidobacteriota bacterium]
MQSVPPAASGRVVLSKTPARIRQA